MKTKNLFSLLRVLVLSQSITAQCNSFKQKRLPYFEATVSVGAIPIFVKGYSEAEILPIGLSLNYKIKRRYSLGLFLGYTRVISHPDLGMSVNLRKCPFLGCGRCFHSTQHLMLFFYMLPSPIFYFSNLSELSRCYYPVVGKDRIILYIY